MTLLTKILITLSAVLGVFSIWVTITKAKIKHFIESIKKATEDGKIEAQEALDLIAEFIGLFK